MIATEYYLLLFSKAKNIFCHDASQIDQLSFHEHEKKYRKSLVIMFPFVDDKLCYQ